MAILLTVLGSVHRNGHAVRDDNSDRIGVMKTARGFALLASVSLLGVNAVAQHHEHGKGELTLSTQDDLLVAEFITDQHTAFGFESNDPTDAQYAEMARVAGILMAKDKLFTVDAGSACDRIDASLDRVGPKGGLESLDAMDDGDDHHDDHDTHDHEAHAEHSEHTEHEEQDMHRDVTVRLVFRCAKAPRIETVRVSAFEQLPGLETVVVTALTATKQSQATLTPGRTQWRVR